MRDEKEWLLDSRLQGINESQRRSRISFLALTIASTALVVATWNSYLSWYRGFAMKPAWPASNVVVNGKDTLMTNPVVAKANELLISEWVKSQSINIAPLGIHIGISDAAILGSFAILVIMVWFYYCQRRENHLIGTLLHDEKNSSDEIRKLVFHSIISNSVFTTISNTDAPIKSLKDARPNETEQLTFSRGAFNVLMLLPPFAIFFIISMDILTVTTIDAVFRLPHKPLWDAMSNHEVKLFGIYMAVALLGFAFSLVLAYWIRSFEKCTRNVLSEFSRLSGVLNPQ